LNNYSREDIGITLTVKPRLSSNNKVTLEVETTIEDVLPGSGASADRPTTTKRSVKTNAIVDHGETIILGGLIKTGNGKSSTKIPILGDIPILGRLFTSQGESQNKINVVIYLTPYIVKKSTDLRKLRSYLDELDSIQEQFNKIVLNKLEKRRLGMEQDKSHITFESSSKKENISYPTPLSPKKSEVNYLPVKTKTTTTTMKPTNIAPSQEQAPLNIDTSDYPVEEIPATRSESILESIHQQNRPIDLNKIDTGIEYNEETTFTNE
jgi:Flp pilus assembly secretin CpaC